MINHPNRSKKLEVATPFKTFSEAVHDRYLELSKNEMFVVDVGDIFATYLAAFPAGSNPLFRERTEHDCNCCKQFIRKLGCLVSINADGTIASVWDNLGLTGAYGEVAARLSEVVRQSPIRTVFRTKEKKYGTDHNYDTKTNQRWDHFYGEVAERHCSVDAETKRGELEAFAQVLRRGLTEIRKEDLDTVLDLIDSNSLYRGQEHRAAVAEFRDLQNKYDGSSNFIWGNIHNRVARFRNTVIGTLLVDLAEGKSLEAAVRAFEVKVAPANYKRPTALITAKMVEEAANTLTQLGLEGAIHRRFARLEDVSVNNVLFVDNSVKGVMKDSIVGLLADAVKPKTVKLEKAEPIGAEDFVGGVLPTATSVSALVQNRHSGNFVSLTGGDGPERLFRWNNNFAWSYDGEVTDSIKQRVKAAGGNTNAKLRVSLAWFNHDDLDLHAYTPDGYHVYYGNKMSILDVDMNAGAGRTRTPVENLAFNRLLNGKYRVWVNQFCRRESADIGFAIEIEYEGRLEQYSYSRGAQGDIPCFDLTVAGGKLTKIEVGPSLVGGLTSVDKWGVKTETLVPVTIILNSPNHWDNQAAGNKHCFFMLKDCKNPNPVRGIYNEFLRPDLEKHRKVFEVLGAKTKCPPTEKQISGVGFSSGRGDNITVVVNGGHAYNVNF